MTVLDYPPAYVEPSYLWVPPGARGTYGPEVVDFAASIGHPVDAEQAAAIDALASYGPGGNYLALESCTIEGRQHGKTDRTLLPLTLADLFLFNAPMITWTAHLMDTTRRTFATVQRLIEENPSLSRRVKEIIEAKSEEAIVLMSGATMEFRARARGGGRGTSGDIWIADEALFLRAESMGSRLPTLSSRPNPQVRYASSAADKDSDHLRSLVRRGRAGNDPSLIFIERCAPGSFKDPGCEQRQCLHAFGTEGCALDREELWHMAGHSLGRRVSYAFVRAERRTLDPVEFARERMGWHEDGPEDGARHPLAFSDWTATGVATSPDVSGRPAFFITIGVDGSACIASAADQPGDRGPHVELADRRPGSLWLSARLLELAKTWPDALFAAGKAGPVAGMVEAGLPVEVELLAPGEMAQACRHHESLMKARGFTHSKDPDVDLSFAGAVSKLVGDGMWTWDWKASVNLAPIAAETGALYLLEKHRGADPLNNIW